MNEQAHNDLLALLSIPGKPGEELAVAEHLHRELIVMGIRAESISSDKAHEQSEYGGNTGNLIVQLDGHGNGPRRMFSAHMDTVPSVVGAVPRLDAGRRRIVNDAPGKALGGDNRTGCAVVMQVARVLCGRANDHAPTTLIFFVQEEVGLVGARGMDVAQLGSPIPAMCFNFDGSRANEFVTSVIGTKRFTIDIEGIAAHAGANPADGVSAAMIAAEALSKLERDGWHGVVENAGGRGSANVGIIQGGTGSNVVMPQLHILAEARSHDPEFREEIITAWNREFLRSVESHANRDGACGEVRFGFGPSYEAFSLSDDDPVVKAVLSAARQCGVDAQCVSNDGGMDANWIVAHGISAVTIGVGQRNVHTPKEFVDLEHFDLACRIATQLAGD
jgi:tripeptide aminopeptidase